MVYLKLSKRENKTRLIEYIFFTGPPQLSPTLFNDENSLTPSATNTDNFRSLSIQESLSDVEEVPRTDNNNLFEVLSNLLYSYFRNSFRIKHFSRDNETFLFFSRSSRYY